jgi:hypothetical protein
MSEETTVGDAPTEALPAIETPAPAPLNDESDKTADEKAPEDKASKALQRRIDRLTREKYQLRAENEQLRTPRQVDEDHPLTDEDVETRAQTLAREITERNEFNARCNDVFDKGQKASKKFTESMQSLAEEVGPVFDNKGNPSTVMAAILDADEPHKLIIYLADKPDLAAELADLSPSRQIRRIAQIEKEMGEDKPKPSTAPKPVQPVKGAGIDAEPDPKDTARWIKWENDKLLAQRARK